MTPPAAAATGRTLPRTVAPRAPRRVSGPAARPKRGGAPAAGRRRAAAPDPFIIRAIERTMRMADSRFLDRLIRGRLWIPLVAMGLMGIVFMQVSMLKLNAGIGRAVQSASTLERQNAKMRAELSGMEAGSKIDTIAKDIGMVAPAASTTPSYVKVGGTAQAAAAVRRMTPADPDAVARASAASGTTATTTGVAATGTAAAATTTSQAQAQAQEQAQAPVTQTQTQTQQTPVTQAQTQTQVQAPPASAQTQTQTQTPVATQQPQQTATATSTSGGAVAPTAG
jgi:hypothetical protein